MSFRHPLDPFTKPPFLILAVLIALLLPLPRASAAPPPAPDAPAVETTLRAFYHWYVHLLNKDERADPVTKQRAEIKQYVTERLLHEIDKVTKGPDGLDGDYFLDSQDWEKDWEKNIAVRAIRIGPPDHATAMVTLSGGGMPPRRLNVVLMAEGGRWKIDKVSPIDR